MTVNDLSFDDEWSRTSSERDELPALQCSPQIESMPPKAVGPEPTSTRVEVSVQAKHPRFNKGKSKQEGFITMHQRKKEPSQLEIQTIRAKHIAMEKSVDASLENLEDEIADLSGRLASLETKRMIQEEEDQVKKQLNMPKAAKFGKMVDAKEAEKGKDELDRDTARISPKTTSEGIHTTTKTGAADNAIVEKPVALTRLLTWFLRAIILGAIVWFSLAAMVAAFAVAVKDQDLFASSTRDCTRILCFLLAWVVFVA